MKQKIKIIDLIVINFSWESIYQKQIKTKKECCLDSSILWRFGLIVYYIELY